MKWKLSREGPSGAKMLVNNPRRGRGGGINDEIRMFTGIVKNFRRMVIESHAHAGHVQGKLVVMSHRDGTLPSCMYCEMNEHNSQYGNSSFQQNGTDETVEVAAGYETLLWPWRESPGWFGERDGICCGETRQIPIRPNILVKPSTSASSGHAWPKHSAGVCFRAGAPPRAIAETPPRAPGRQSHPGAEGGSGHRSGAGDKEGQKEQNDSVSEQTQERSATEPRVALVTPGACAQHDPRDS